MIKAILVDDEVNNVNNLRLLLQKYCPEVEVIAAAHSAQNALKIIQLNTPDLLFLDIEMPEGSGFELLEQLNNPTFEVIFVTAFDKYALKAIKYSALDYLLKPIDIQELQQAVHKVQRKLNTRQLQEQLEILLQNLRGQNGKSAKIALPTAERIDFVEVPHISHCRGDNNYTHVQLIDNQCILVAKTLKEFEELLTEHGFFRTHQSWLVNLHQVRSFVRKDGGYALMKDGTQIPVTQQRRKAFLQQLR